MQPSLSPPLEGKPVGFAVIGTFSSFVMMNREIIIL